MLLVTGALLVARFMGLGLGKVEQGNNDETTHMQFSIGEALMWTTALAVFMSGTHYLTNSRTIYKDELESYFSISRLAVGLATIWLICGGRADKTREDRIAWIAVRFITLLLLIGIGADWALRVGMFSGSPWWGAFILASEAVVTAASLVVVRLAGYRLMWRWPFRAPHP
jgi:hypothetical protein